MLHKQNYSLLNHNTFGIDVVCRDFYEYNDRHDLSLLFSAGVFDAEWLPIGGGSNLLLMNDLSYPVLQSCMKDIELVGEDADCVFVKVGSGCVWDDFVAYAVSNNWGGVENLSYIPGMVGASPVQNIGAYGVEAKDVIVDVEVYDTKNDCFKTIAAKDCAFGYRDSVFKKEKDYIVVSVLYRLFKNDHYQLKLGYGNVEEVVSKSGDYTLSGVREAIVGIRKSKLPEPSEIGSAGSFFKNPVVSADCFKQIQKEYPDVPYYELGGDYKIPAAWLISQCGWKGKSIGSAGVYEKQPLILVNRGGATGADVQYLMEQVQQTVLEKFSIALHPEVCIIK